MIPGMNEWNSNVFSCPATGWGVYLTYDDENGEVFAQRCETDEWAPVDLDEIEYDQFNFTAIWCEQFGIQYCDTLEEAQTVAESLGTTF